MTKRYTNHPYIRDFGGTTYPIVVSAPGFTDEAAYYNPSIAYGPDGRVYITLRVNRSAWQIEAERDGMVANFTPLGVVDLETGVVSDITMLENTTPSGVGDIRLVHRDHGWQLSGTIYGLLGRELAVMSECKISTDNKIVVDMIPSPRGQIEKNWMPTDHPTEEFDYIYGEGYVIKDRELIQRSTLSKLDNRIRGGSQLLLQPDGSYIALAHILDIVGNGMDYYARMRGRHLTESSYRLYTHLFVRYDSTGTLTHVGDEFIFEQERIEFACGMVEKDGNFYISYGDNDFTARLAVIPVENALATLKPVQGATSNGPSSTLTS